MISPDREKLIDEVVALRMECEHLLSVVRKGVDAVQLFSIYDEYRNAASRVAANRATERFMKAARRALDEGNSNAASSFE